MSGILQAGTEAANPVPDEEKTPGLEHIKVFPEQHEKIMINVGILRGEFIKKAESLGIPIRYKGKYRNIPGQPEAMEYFFAGIPMAEYINRLIDREVNRITKRGAQ